MPKQFLLRSAVLLLLGILGFNLVAFNQASSMLNYSQSGTRTGKPENLSIWRRMSVLVTGVTNPKPQITDTPEEHKLPYKTYQLANKDIKLEAWYLPHKNSVATIIMFHGYASSKSSLLTEAQAFNELGFSTFLVDFRGSGGSNQNTTSIGYYEAEDVKTSVDYVKNTLRQKDVILYGQSMGGVAILRAVAQLEVKPKGIVIEAVFDTMTGTVANRFDAMGLPSFPASHILIFWASVISGYWGFDHNPIDYARQIKCPTLLLHGAQDTRATLKQGRAVYAQLNTDKKIAIFDELGHESYASANPKKWKETISQISQWLK